MEWPSSNNNRGTPLPSFRAEGEPDCSGVACVFTTGGILGCGADFFAALRHPAAPSPYGRPPPPRVGGAAPTARRRAHRTRGEGAQ
ncbi:hypothetical protein GCM10027294_06630 [Marinactinospora endophytica]